MTNGAREPGWTLRRRLQAIITLALLPVVLVSIFQGVARANSTSPTSVTRLLQSARTVAAGDQNLLAAAEQVLRAVGSLSEVRGMNGNCDGVLADTLIGVRYFSNLSRIDADGRVACSAMALAHGLSVKEYAVFKEAQKSDGMVVSNELINRVTGQPVIGGDAGAAQARWQLRRHHRHLAGRALDRLHDARRQPAQGRGGGGL